MSELPISELRGWSQVELGMLIERIEAGKNFRCTERPPGAGETGIVKISAVTWGVFDQDESKTIEETDQIEPKLLIKKGDLLISRANTLELVGSSVVVDGISKRLQLSDKVLRLRVKLPIEHWLNFFLRSRYGRQQIEAFATGAQMSMRNISQANLRRIRVPLPPLEEQQRIVDKIETLFARLDKAEAAVREVQRLLTRYRRSILKSAVVGQLTNDLRSTTEGHSASDVVSEILERRRNEWAGRGKYKQPQELDKNGLALLPGGWAWVSLDALLAEFITGPFGSALHKSDYVEDGTPLINPINIVDGRIVPDLRKCVDQDALKRLARFRVRKGDIVIARRGDMGRCAAVTDKEDGWLCGTGSMIMRPTSSVDPNFLSAAIRSATVVAHLEANSVGTTMKNLNQRALLSAPIAIPSKFEQTEVVAEIDRTFDKVKSLSNWCETELKRSVSLRQSILRGAFAGRLVPQDPSDEPASALLARIADAKAPTKKTRRKVQA